MRRIIVYLVALYCAGLIALRDVKGSTGSGLYQPFERFGLYDPYSKTHQALTDYHYADLGTFGWFSDGQTEYPNCPGRLSFPGGHQATRTITVGQTGQSPPETAVEQLLDRHPDWPDDAFTWQIGSRPGWDGYTTQPGQFYPDRYQTESYVRDFECWRRQIQRADPGARIMSGQVYWLVTETSGNDTRGFLEETIREYYTQFGTAMPIDVFNLGLFINGSSPDFVGDLTSAVVEFRRWLANVPLADGVYHDYSDSEVWLGAFGFSKPVFGMNVERFMTGSVQWLMGTEPGGNFDLRYGLGSDEHRLVQRWAWYASRDTTPGLRACNLFTEQGDLTDLGRCYAALIPDTCPEPMSLFIFMSGALCLPIPRRR